MSLYSVVVPVYNSEHTLEELYRRLEKVFREVIKEDFELILVDDGSKDCSFEVMTELRNIRESELYRWQETLASILHFCAALRMSVEILL